MKQNELPHDAQEYKRQLVDLLYRTDKVLSSSGVEYFAVFGTCLGAVREHGIIPWDDDVDIAVRRCDYDKAIDVLHYSKEQLFVNVRSFRSSRIFNRICAEDSLEKKRAYIDLYVIDYAPKSLIHFRWNVFWYIGITRVIKKRSGQSSAEHPILYFLTDIFSFPLRILPTTTLQKLARWFYVYDRSSPLCKLSYDANRKRYPSEYFLCHQRMPFHAMTVPVPAAYDEYLTMSYGDWRTPPKDEDRFSHAFDESGLIWNVSLPLDSERSLIIWHARS